MDRPLLNTCLHIHSCSLSPSLPPPYLPTSYPPSPSQDSLHGDLDLQSQQQMLTLYAKSSAAAEGKPDSNSSSGSNDSDMVRGVVATVLGVK